jgi:uroporphyrinogen decarboxylase
MTSVERVNRTLDFLKADRTPVMLWWMPATVMKYGERFKNLIEKHHQDIAFVGRQNPEDDDTLFREGTFTDIWGCRWENVNPGFAGQVFGHPLEDLSALKSYRPPLDQAVVGFENVKRQIETTHRNNQFALASPGVGIFHRMDFLRGTMNLYMDVMDVTNDVKRLRDMVFEYKMRELDGYLETEIDGVQLNDDWGSQRSLLIPPSVWRDFMKPCYREYFSRVKKAGKRVFFHSDGYIREIYPDLIEIGVEALNSQVWCMGVESLGREFAGKITFYGEVDRQGVLSKGSPEAAKCAMDTMSRWLKTEKGGLIGQAEVGPDVSLETIETLLSAWA